MKSFNTSAEETSSTVSPLIFYYFLFSILKIPNTKTGFKKAALGVFLIFFFSIMTTISPLCLSTLHCAAISMVIQCEKRDKGGDEGN